MPKVLIVGAGPVGLACALELTRLGIAVRIIDKNVDKTHLSKAVGINARTLELLEPSGITGQLLAQGIKITRVNLREGNKVKMRVKLDCIPHRFNFMLALPQSETEAILAKALQDLGVTIERNTELLSFTQDEHQVDAVVAKDHEHSHCLVDYLVGADGAHSCVRKQLNIPFHGNAYPDDWSLADIEMHWPYGDKEAQLFMNQKGHGILFAIPIGTDRLRVISNDGDVLNLLPEECDVKKVHWQTEFTVSKRQVVRYQQGRIFLAGDAAHIHSPAGGRGMNLGIEDAFILADMISSGDVAHYSEARHKVGAHVVRESDIQFRLAALKNPIARFFRDMIILPLVNRPFLQKPMLTRMAGIHHR